MSQPGAILGRWLGQKINEKLGRRKSNKKMKVKPGSKDEKYAIIWNADLNDPNIKEEMKKKLSIHTEIEEKIVFSWGKKYFYKGKYSQAKLCFEQVIEYNPDNFKAWNLIGVVLLKENKRYEASNQFRLAYEHSPENKEAHQNLKYVIDGKIYLILKKYDG